MKVYIVVGHRKDEYLDEDHNLHDSKWIEAVKLDKMKAFLFAGEKKMQAEENEYYDIQEFEAD